MAKFRADYPPAECHSAGHTWRYRRVGAGTEPVMWLTGALGLGDFAFVTVPALGEEFRVVLPDYPAACSLDEMANGLIAILDAERLDDVHVVAGSLGGMVAQDLVRRHRKRVRSLVLSHTAAPEPSRVRALAVQVLVASLGLWPEWLVRRLFRRRLRDSFGVGDPFWLRYFDSSSVALSHAQLVSRVRLAAQFAGQRGYKPSDLEGWPGRILIVEADDDPLMPAATRATLHALYPRAEVHTFSRTGHSAAITDPQGYVQIIRGFLLSRAA